MYLSDDFVDSNQGTKVEGNEFYKHHTEFRSRSKVEVRRTVVKQLSGAKPSIRTAFNILPAPLNWELPAMEHIGAGRTRRGRMTVIRITR